MTPSISIQNPGAYNYIWKNFPVTNDTPNTNIPWGVNLYDHVKFIGSFRTDMVGILDEIRITVSGSSVLANYLGMTNKLINGVITTFDHNTDYIRVPAYGDDAAYSAYDAYFEFDIHRLSSSTRYKPYNLMGYINNGLASTGQILYMGSGFFEVTSVVSSISIAPITGVNIKGSSVFSLLGY